MIYNKVKKGSKIINWIFRFIIIAIIVSALDTITYACPVLLLSCVVDIVWWLVFCNKNKNSEEYSALNNELKNSIRIFVICTIIIVVALLFN